MRNVWIGVTAVILLGSCQQVQGWLGEKKETDSTQVMRSEGAYAALARDESITRENAYSDLFLDSAAVERFIVRSGIDAAPAARIRDFYRVRNDQFAWFSSQGLTEQGRGLWSLSQSTEGARRDPSDSLVLRMDSLMRNDSVAFSADSTLITTELLLTQAFVDIALKNKGAVTASNYYLLVPRRKVDPMELADSLLRSGQDSVVGAANRQYAALRQHLRVYQDAVTRGGWQPLTAVPSLRTGTRSPAIAQLKKRLVLSGDHPAADTSDRSNDTLVANVRSVQARFGLRPTGKVTDSLLHELNVPAEARLEQILVNMNRTLWLPDQQDSSVIRINIPSQELVVYTDTGVVLSMPVIVGQEGSGTMAFNDRISTVVFSPYWNIPESIVRDELLPAMQRDPAYLKRHNMEIVKQNDSLPQVRQVPGPDNALGQVKFLFPNAFNIFLHDTPHKDLFARKDRALSHGCIRVARPDSLARYILRGQPEWTPARIAAAMSSGKEQKVAVKRPEPVSISYYTAWTGADGKLQFRRDLYGYDAQTAGLMFLKHMPG